MNYQSVMPDEKERPQGGNSGAGGKPVQTEAYNNPHSSINNPTETIPTITAHIPTIGDVLPTESGGKVTIAADLGNGYYKGSTGLTWFFDGEVLRDSANVFASNGSNGDGNKASIPPNLEPASQPDTEQPSVNGSGAANSDKGQSILLKDLLEIDFPPLYFLIDGMIAKGYLAVIGGRPKSGKSYLILQAMQAIDTSKTFLDRPTKRGRILYVALEDGGRRIQKRCKESKWQPTSNIVVRFDIGVFDGLTSGQPGAGLRELAIEAKNYDLIIIDTLVRTLSGKINENDNAAMGAIFNELASIAKKEDTAILLIHHVTKGDAADPFDLFRGASALRGAYDVGLLLQRKPGDQEAVLHIEAKDFETSSITLKQGANGIGWDFIGKGDKRESIRAGEAIIQIMELWGEGKTAEEYADLMNITKEAARGQLNRAERDGYVYHEEGKKPDKGRTPFIWFLNKRQ